MCWDEVDTLLLDGEGIGIRIEGRTGGSLPPQCSPGTFWNAKALSGANQTMFTVGMVSAGARLDGADWRRRSDQGHS